MHPTDFRDDADVNPIAAIRQYPLVVFAFALLFSLLGVAFAARQPAAFSARSVIVVEDARAPTISNAGSSDAERYVADQVAILESRIVGARASDLAAELDPPLEITVDDFLSNTKVTSNSDSNVITISFVAGSAAKAQAGAEAVGQSYEQVIEAALAEDAQRATAELDEAIASAVDEIGEVQGQIEALRSDNDERVELDTQLDEIVVDLVELRKESEIVLAEDIAGVTPEQRLRVADVSARIQLLSEELRSRLLVSDGEAQVPATALLLRQREDAAALLSELTLRRSQIEVDARLAGNGVAFLAPSGTGRPRGISTSSAAVLMFAVGALIGAGVAYWLSQRRRLVDNRLTPQNVLEAPLLARVPRFPGRGTWGQSDGAEDAAMLAVLNDPASAQAEAFRVIVGVLMQRLEMAKNPQRGSAAAWMLDAERGPIIAVCSSMIGEGKTVVAANTALAAGRAGLRTALVDADFGTQDAVRLMSTVPHHGRSVGLTEVVLDGVRLEDAITDIDVGVGGSVGLLGRGRVDVAAPELLGSKAAGSVLTQLAGLYDVVIVDLPPLLEVAYATSFIQKADLALVVVRHESPLDNLTDLRSRLDLIGVDALGYVYSDAPGRRRSLLRRPSPGDVLGTASPS